MPAPLRDRPERVCDVVMKGGITSGVVYPHAVLELAGTYRFKNIGGTSAGAIAAVAAAAAEYGRAGGGFERLGELPAWLGREANLVSLFQPQRGTRRLMGLLLAGIGEKAGRGGRLAGSALRLYWPWALLGALPGLALAAVLIWQGGEPLVVVAAAVAAALLVAAGAAGALLGRVVREAQTAIPANRFGLCTGMPGADGGRPALTPWLADLVDDLAFGEGRERTGPLTFGHLWAGPDADRTEADPDEPWMRLEMMTTNVTNRRAERLPWASREYLFDPAQFRALLPERVVAWMEAHPPPLPEAAEARRESQLLRGLLWPLRPLPSAADMPVVVATRMSLSFPVLLSAVPLWRVDWTRTHNQAAKEAWLGWTRTSPEQWAAVADSPERIAGVVSGPGKPRPETCWFSDGGVASNFPVHFFDAFLPRHPTFAINLRPFHPDRERSDDECENVWLAQQHGSGQADWWYPVDGDLVAFLGGLVRTMQNRVDDAQARLPGYRDRIVHVSLTAHEGGMNLKMPREVIEALTERGRCAGELLVSRFAATPSDPRALSWDDHRWVRYRSTIAALAAMLDQIATAYGSPAEPTYLQLLLRGDQEPPPSYRMRARQRDLARSLTEGLVDVAARHPDAATVLGAGAPSPAPAARLVPQDAPVRKRDA
jgi:hypothetical protein